jgi:hypothetical protein
MMKIEATKRATLSPRESRHEQIKSGNIRIKSITVIDNDTEEEMTFDRATWNIEIWGD